MGRGFGPDLAGTPRPTASARCVVVGVQVPRSRKSSGAPRRTRGDSGRGGSRALLDGAACPRGRVSPANEATGRVRVASMPGSMVRVRTGPALPGALNSVGGPGSVARYLGSGWADLPPARGERPSQRAAGAGPNCGIPPDGAGGVPSADVCLPSSQRGTMSPRSDRRPTTRSPAWTSPLEKPSSSSQSGRMGRLVPLRSDHRRRGRWGNQDRLVVVISRCRRHRSVRGGGEASERSWHRPAPAPSRPRQGRNLLVISSIVLTDLPTVPVGSGGPARCVTHSCRRLNVVRSHSAGTST